jgi:hypothetical protein
MEYQIDNANAVFFEQVRIWDSITPRLFERYVIYSYLNYISCTINYCSFEKRKDFLKWKKRVLDQSEQFCRVKAVLYNIINTIIIILDTTDQYLTNVIGILRAERAMDNEGFVLTSRYDTRYDI